MQVLRRSYAAIILVLAAILLAGSPLTGSQPRNGCAEDSFPALVERPLQVAREIELYIDDPFLQLLTTSDARTWDELPPHQKKEWLRAVGAKADFARDRTIAGFAMKSKVRIRAPRDFTFRGNRYLRGELYDLDLTNFLMPKVEYGHPGATKTLDSFELHFRGETPSALRSDIAAFFDNVIPAIGSGVTPLSDHQHIPGQIPYRLFSDLKSAGYSSETGPVLLTLYHQMAELAMMVENAKGGMAPTILPKPDGTLPHIMDYLDRDSVAGVYEYFSALSRGENPKIGVALKKNTIGVRGSDTYTEGDLWGLELRFYGWIYSNRAELSQVADGIKQSLAKKDFVIPFHVAANFADEHRGQLKDALGKIWFRKSPSEIAADHDGYPNRELVEAALLKNNRKSYEPPPRGTHNFYALLPILYQNWQKHPIVKYGMADSNQVAQAQAHYLQKAISGSGDPASLVFDFLRDSGLQRVLDTVVKRSDHGPVPRPLPLVVAEPVKPQEPPPRPVSAVAATGRPVTAVPPAEMRAGKYVFKRFDKVDAADVLATVSAQRVKDRVGFAVGASQIQSLTTDSKSPDNQDGGWYALNYTVYDAEAGKPLGLIQFSRMSVHKIAELQVQPGEKTGAILAVIDYGDDPAVFQTIVKGFSDQVLDRIGVDRVLARARPGVTDLDPLLTGIGFTRLKGSDGGFQNFEYRSGHP